MKTKPALCRPSAPVFIITALALVPLGVARAQLLSNLEAFGNSVSLIDRSHEDPAALESDGPKELATADFDGDGRPDLAASKVLGRVVVVFGEGGKNFSETLFLDPPAETGELRSIAAADFDGDTLPDIAVAAPYSGRVVVFGSNGDRTFAAPQTIDGWLGVRALLPLDLDNDGDQDLITAGPLSDEIWNSDKAIARAMLNDGTGSFEAGPELRLDGGTWRDQFPRPVFAMVPLPPFQPGEGERAVVTHPNSDLIWVVALGEGGALWTDKPLQAFLPTRALAVGPVLTQDGLPDLVQAARDENQILVRAGNAEGRFEDAVSQRIYVPGEPRALALSDVDADGWRDLLVVLREFDRVVTFKNEEGEFKLVAEAPVGISPRDLETADFNGDGRLDLAVSNRRSDDLTVLLTQADGPGFERLDSVYPVDGGVSGLLLNDINGDGLADAIQSHLLTEEITVRLAAAGGVFTEPIYTKLDSPPLAMRPGDFNSDGRTDLIIVHSDRSRPGISMLYGTGTGAFEPPSFVPSVDRLFSVIVADFDGDGVKDAAVGNYDCRLSMFKGSPDGEFELVRTGLFTYEARAMVAGDFDADGDIDLAGASATGIMTVIENDGNLLKDPGDTPHIEVFKRTDIPSPASKGRIKSMVRIDWNGDDDMDLAINSKDGVSIFVGGEGLTFEAEPTVIPGTRGASDLALGDFDSDGTPDLATACQLLSCVVILKGQEGGGQFQLATVAPVPSSDYIAVGDVDGDGQPDIAGSGEVLWVALSSRAPDKAGGSLGTSRPAQEKVVINELLASNKTLILGSGGKTPDVIELYNGTGAEVPMQNWTLTYQRRPNPFGVEYDPVTYAFPPRAKMDADGRLVVFCDNKGGDGIELHTTFKLSSEGATLTLRDPSGEVIDEIAYEDQREDLSLGRFTDGVKLLTERREPDIGAPNFTFGTSIKPEIKSVSVEPSTVVPKEGVARVRLVVKAEDEVGIFTMSAIYRTMDGRRTGRVGLFDDGMNNDGGALDGVFATEIEELPAGTDVEFFLEATNLIDKDETDPGDPIFSLPGQPVTNYAFTIPEQEVPAALTVQISEVQPSGRGTRGDQEEGTDYIELRNTGDAPVSLEGLALRDSLFDTTKSGPLSGTLAPGEHAVFFADNDPKRGAQHLPFKLSGGGDSVWLVAVDELGVVTVVEKVRPDDDIGKQSWSRLGSSGEFAAMPPTQGSANVPAGELHVAVVPGEDGVARAMLRLAFGTPFGRIPIVESFTPERGSWSEVQSFAGDGFEKFLDVPIGEGTELFRVRE